MGTKAAGRQNAGGHLCQPGGWRSSADIKDERRHSGGIDVRRLSAGAESLLTAPGVLYKTERV